MFNINKISKTDFLLPKNNFWVGFGSILNLSGSYFSYNTSKTPEQADLKSLFSDWLNVGNDFKVSKSKFEKKFQKELKLK